MGEYRDEKRRLYRRLIVNGAKRDEFKKVASNAAVAAPNDLIDKWEERFFQSPITTYPAEPRLINRFCVGADPEFVFEQPKVNLNGAIVPGAGNYIHAEQLGLGTMEAFGCDMSGRQAELRAYPSRFVLEVVASLVDALRWMNDIHGLDKFNWIAPARYADDGVGGHVHIGRKRPDAPICIESLDSVTKLLLAADVLDSKGQQIRIGRTHYGRYGDWRPQQHGYEYRTMPSWMTSPWAAFFTLVVSKLCVLDDAREFLGNDRPKETLTNLLRAYKSRDDDARIALIALEKLGFPKYEPSSFKERWGVGPYKRIDHPIDRLFVPPVLQSTPKTNQQLFNHLVSGKPMETDHPKPSWEPFVLPDGVYKPNVQIHAYGISDVAQGLLSKGCVMQFNRAERYSLDIQSHLKLDARGITEAAKKMDALADWSVRVRPIQERISIPTLYVSVPNDIYDNRTHATNKDKRNALRSLLVDSGFFPVFKYGDYDKPLKDAPKMVKKRLPKPLGKVVSNVQGEQEPEGERPAYAEFR